MLNAHRCCPTQPSQVRYIVEADSFLLEYLTKQQLALEVFEARGWDVRALGVAHLPLAALLNDLEMGAGERVSHGGGCAL